MPLASGTRLGLYEIVSPLGAGGMGEVYRARDTQLGRDVAIKILPAAFAADTDRLSRFDHEARTLASLNHPNIAHVYGFENGALVMELLEGDTLRDRLKDGPLPPRKAIEYATQIARGLAAAHERGVIHRDLKPENVFVLRDGRVKILDFGLARSLPPAAAAGVTAAAATITTPGTVMGTVGYMSPEQVRGGEIDARSDLFALGAVMYEMLAGQPAFKRETPAETMTAILREDPPDLVAARADLPPALDRIVRHCLEKNPLERFQTARDVAFALEALSGAVSGATSGPTPIAPASGLNRGIERAAWAGAIVALAATAAWLAVTRAPTPTQTEGHGVRTILPLPENVSVDTTPIAPLRIGICANGERVAYVGASPPRQSAVWVQSLVDAEAHELKGTEGAIGPTWSLDCRLVAVNTAGFLVKVIDATQGSSVTGARIGYAMWFANGELIGTSGSPEWIIRRSNGADKQPTTLMKPAEKGESMVAVAILPDQLHMAVVHHKPGHSTLDIATVDGRESRQILDYPDLGTVHMVDDAILFSRTDRLFAQSFDAKRRQPVGEPVLLANRLDTSSFWGAAFDAASSVIVYSGGREDPKSRLTWMDRTGRMLSTLGDDADYSNVELSPDGRRLVVSVTDPSLATRDIYVVDLDRGVRQRLTFDPSDERSAVWSPDGRELVYNSKGLDLYRRPSDFTGTDAPVLVDSVSKDPRQVSADGKLLLFRRSGQGTRNDIWIMPLDGSGKPTPLVATPFDENYATFSPDARSVVYMSDESGRPEVYVISREGGGGKAQISSSGGTFPRWRHDGKEIVYLAADQTLMSVPVTGSGATFKAGTPNPLFKIAVQPGAGVPFDLSPDGARVIVNARIPPRLAPYLNVITNWQAELLARARPPEVRSSGSAR